MAPGWTLRSTDILDSTIFKGMAVKPMTGHAFFVLTVLVPQDMPFRRPRRLLPVVASALAAAGIVLAVAGCSNIAPLGPDPLATLPPARHLRSPIIMQVMHSQPPTPAGKCPAGSVGLFGLDPAVPRSVVSAVRGPARPVHGSTAAPASTATLPAPPPPSAGVACYLPVGRPVTVTFAAVSSVTTYPHQGGPAPYGFVVAFPHADVAALTALIMQAYYAGDALGMSVAGRLWQAPQPRNKFGALRAAQINLLSRSQAVQLHRLLVPSG
jgi:hypothetical protein